MFAVQKHSLIAGAYLHITEHFPIGFYFPEETKD